MLDFAGVLEISKPWKNCFLWKIYDYPGKPGWYVFAQRKLISSSICAFFYEWNELKYGANRREIIWLSAGRCFLRNRGRLRRLDFVWSVEKNGKVERFQCSGKSTGKLSGEFWKEFYKVKTHSFKQLKR